MFKKLLQKIGYVIGYGAAIIVVVPLIFQITKRLKHYTNDNELISVMAKKIIAETDCDYVMWHPFKSRKYVTELTNQEINKWIYDM